MAITIRSRKTTQVGVQIWILAFALKGARVDLQINEICSFTSTVETAQKEPVEMITPNKTNAWS